MSSLRVRTVRFLRRIRCKVQWASANDLLDASLAIWGGELAGAQERGVFGEGVTPEVMIEPV
jgi:hypothetical protein